MPISSALEVLRGDDASAPGFGLGANRMRASIREHFERDNADLTVDQDESVSLGGAFDVGRGWRGRS
jgi:hypothetical protein